MKIIQPGIVKYMVEPIRFSCRHCGCVFEADAKECSQITDYCGYLQGHKEAFCVCPACRERCSTIINC